MTAEEQAVGKIASKNKILKEETDSQCQLCKQHRETSDHLTSGGPILAKNEYLMRRGRVGAYLYYSICKRLCNEMTEKITHAQSRTSI